MARFRLDAYAPDGRFSGTWSYGYERARDRMDAMHDMPKYKGCTLKLYDRGKLICTERVKGD